VATKKASVDWEAVEIQYRAGIRSLKDIGAEFGVSDAGIIKRAKRDSWTRDLKAKIQARANAKVSAATVSAEVSAQTKITEKLTVEVEGEVLARIHLGHRRDIGKARSMLSDLMLELEHQTGSQELYHQLFELLSDPEAEEEGANKSAQERQRKRRELFEKALSLGGRTKTMKDLADTLKTLIALEREAYDIGTQQGQGEGGNQSAILTDNDIARRIAFVLARGMNQKKE
jgi:hypothetical protein